MKQIYNILNIAALVLAGTLTTGCNNLKEELEVSTPGTALGKTVTVKSTVGLDTSTKALTAAGVKTFAADETIAVFYTNESSDLVKTTYTFTAGDLIDGGRRATITVSMTDPQADGAVKYIYPASMAKDDGSVNYNALKSQNGTLATIATKYDLAVYEGTLTGDAALPSGVTLLNQLAILELTVKNASGIPVNGSVTKLSVFDGTNVYKIIDRSTVDEPIYVALRPITSDKTIHFCATDGTKIYRKSVTDKTLSRNNIYPVNLLTTETTGTALEFLTADYEVKDGDTLSGILLGKYKITTASTTADAAAITVTLDGVDVNHIYAVSTSAPGINYQGNTNLVLKAGSKNYVTACTNGYAGISIRSGSTLTISGSGSLTAVGTGDSSGNYHGGAGIGGYRHGDAGNIVITGGTIIARGGRGAAGIGCGSTTSKNNTCGAITISGGTVTATGGMYGAGIGTGTAWTISAVQRNKCGAITISGGTVTATGGRYAAGIGGGLVRNNGERTAYVECGTITITSDVSRVEATKGHDSANIIGRGGRWSGGGTQSCGTITIDGTTSFEFTTSTTQFVHFNSTLSTTTNENDTWTLTHK